MAVVNFSGIASGIDSASLIQAILDQQRNARIKPLEEKIASYEDTNSAFSELKTKLETFKESASKFRALTGGVLSKQAISSNETVVSATAVNGAQAGSYDLTVTSKAKNATFSFNDRFNSTTQVINSAINDGASDSDRTVSFNIGSGDNEESVSVVLSSTTTAAEFVTQFNSQSSKATATLVNVGTASSPSYAIVINSDNEGTDNGTITLDSVGAELASGSGAFQANTLSQAEDSNFTVSGIAGTFTRSTNTISDVIQGVSFSIQNTGNAKISITGNPGSTTQTVREFVESYNDLYKFVQDNDLITQEQDGEVTLNIFSPLASTSIDENLISAIRSAFSSSSISGGTVNVLSDLGITTDRDGSLSFEEETFSDALASDPESVELLLGNLGESLASVDGTIAQFLRFNGIIDTSIRTNTTSIRSLNDQIGQIEISLSKQEQALNSQYGRLESLMGRLNNQQSALTSLLSG